MIQVCQQQRDKTSFNVRCFALVEKYEPCFTGQNNPEEEEEWQDVQKKKNLFFYT